MGLPKQKKKLNDQNIEERLKALPNNSKEKKAGRPTSFKIEETKKVTFILSKEIINKLSLAHAQEQIKTEQTLSKSYIVNKAIKEYLNKLGY